MVRLGVKIKYVLAAALLLVLVALTTFCGGAFSAYAVSSYSNVLDDLRKDGAFDVEAYPTVKGDNSLNVIQIAESTDGELFIYVYQPSADERTTATTISIAEQLNNSDDLQPVLYGLELISNTGVFYKYKVTGYKVSGGKERFYNVIMIQRPYVGELDGASGDGNIINRKAYAVGQYWYATTTDNGDVKYRMLEVDVVRIINPLTRYIRKRKVSTGASTTDYYQDNYYVAFSTDRNIDKLLSASLEYRIRDYYYKSNDVLSFGSTSFGEKAVFTNERLTTRNVYADETVDLQQQGFTLLFGAVNLNKKFTWNRIQSSDEFVNNAGAAASDNDEIKNLQWVLMFEETSAFSYRDGSLITVYEETGQIIDNVTILRLEFVEDGVTYNLGAVSETVSGKPPFGGGSTDPNDPNDPDDGGNNIPWWVWLLVALGGLALVTLVIYIAVPAARPVISKCLAAIFKGLWWLICLPFRLIAAIIKAIANAVARRKATAATKTTTRKTKTKKAGKRK